MLFNSLSFLAFFLVVLATFHGLARHNWRGAKGLLLVASWFFYATWSPAFLSMLIATTWIDFHLARWIYDRRIDRPQQARWGLIASVGLNLGLLGFFKYGEFLYGSLGGFAALPEMPAILRVGVPLGISFYTFHSISYIIDTYRGLRPPTLSFGDYALYVAFFPQLIAGPIMRWGFFGPQLERPTRVLPDDADRALFLLAKGFVKKVVCADALGGYVDDMYIAPVATGTIELWITLYAYAFQIYFDFSGYTDIAQGAARLLGFRLPPNFEHPYSASNPSEFWQRWHISLSTWLRDYLYISLGGNRRGAVRTYWNLFLTMLLGGLWHGAAWTFVAWGAFHGLWLAVHRAVSSVTGPPRSPLWLRRVVTFHLVALAWVPFRSTSFGDAATVLGGLFTLSRPWGRLPIECLVILALGFMMHAWADRRDLYDSWRRLPTMVRGFGYAATVIAVGLCSTQTARFIYFAF